MAQGSQLFEAKGLFPALIYVVYMSAILLNKRSRPFPYGTV
jgi:hypothetical protein